MPLLNLVALILSGDPRAEIFEAGQRINNPAIMFHLAMLHTIFNGINTILFLPFVNQFAKLVTFLIRDKKTKEESTHYAFTTFPGAITDAPELNILRVEKEIRDMAGIVSSMYASFSNLMRSIQETKDKESAAAKLCEELKQQEEYIDEMKEILSGVLIESTREQLNTRTGQRVTRLLRVIGRIEEMSDECYSISRLLEKCIRKNCIFNDKEMEDLIPYVGQVGEFLGLLQKQLGQSPAAEFAGQTVELETNMNKSRKKLQKLGRKRIEAGENVRKELFFIDLVNRIEKLGDYCMGITWTITN
jgi:phosphate:Na+ symporter